MRHRMLLVWTLGFAAGIVAETVRGPWLGVWAALGILGLGLLLAGSGPRWAVALAGIAFAGLGAGAIRLAASEVVPPTDISHWAGHTAPVMLTGSVVNDPEVKHGGRVMLTLRVEKVEQYGETHAATGNVSVTLNPEALVGIAAPDYGDLVTLGGRLDIPADATNPGAFSWRDYLARRSVWCELHVKRSGAIRRARGSALNPALQLAWTVRRHVLWSVKSALPPAESALLSGILFGKRADLPPDLMSDFVHTGTVHILASAGLHVGVVAFWILWLCERLTLPRKTSAVLIVATLWLYALMAGGRPSVTRAVVMATVYFGAIFFEREQDTPTTLAAAALVILLVQPTAILEAGFQLSFLTVLTLMLAMPLWQRVWRPLLTAKVSHLRLRKVLWWMVEMAGLSLFAQMGALPIVAADYNEVSLLGFAANALVVPVLFLLIPLGLVGACVWNLWHAAGAVLLHGAGWGLTYIAFVVTRFGESAWSYRAIVTPSALDIAVYYLLVFGTAFWLARLLPKAEAQDVPTR